ncbi:hypothetical protein O0L34_g18484 [Tuta absoluta]|nr:hypothetical protein O0L34_g18484 [Tuta absoluta]
MGPQFVFKTYNCTGSNSSLSEAETVEVEPMSGSGGGVARSNPVNMPSARPIVPVLVHSGSTSEYTLVISIRRGDSGSGADVRQWGLPPCQHALREAHRARASTLWLH